MKRLAIVAVVALLCLSVKGYAQTHEAKQTQASKQPAAPVPTVAAKEDHGQPLKEESEKHVNADVRVVQTPEKDGYDHAAFWANIALVLVGIGGICVAIATLFKIKNQAEEMRLQRVAMEDSLKAINRQADLMERQANIAEKTLVLQLRPRIIVRGGSVTNLNEDPLLNGDPPGTPASGEVHFVVVNIGGTPARITNCGAVVKTSTQLSTPLMDGATQFGERILQSGEAWPCNITLEESTTLTVSSAIDEWVEAQPPLFGAKRPAISVNPSPAINFIGLIVYMDDLGIKRTTSFFRLFDPSKRRFVLRSDPEAEYSD
jgi:hypothetical protein